MNACHCKYVICYHDMRHTEVDMKCVIRQAVVGFNQWCKVGFAGYKIVWIVFRIHHVPFLYVYSIELGSTLPCQVFVLCDGLIAVAASIIMNEVGLGQRRKWECGHCHAGKYNVGITIHVF